MSSRRPRSRAVLVFCALALAGLSLAPSQADAQYVGRFREIQFRFFAGCTNETEQTLNLKGTAPAGSVRVVFGCAGGSAELTVEWAAPANTPVAQFLPGTFVVPLTILTTATARWQPPTSGFPAPPYRLTVAAGTQGSCVDRQERTNFPAGISTLAASRTCSFGAPASSADPLPPGLNGGFSAGAASQSWGGSNYLGSVYYDFVPATGADLSVAITGTQWEPANLYPRVVVRNGGPADATGVALSVEVRRSIPDVTTTVADPGCAPGATFTGFTRYSCPIGTLAPGAERAFQFVSERKAAWMVAPKDTYDASVTATSQDPEPANDKARREFWHGKCDSDGYRFCPFAGLACITTGGSASPPAPAASRTRGFTGWLANALDLGPLYRLRDDVFARSTAGRRYTELYYAHGAEVAGRLVADAAFRSQFGSAYGLWQDHVLKLVDGQGASATITQAQIDALLGVLASLESWGSPELRGAIAREKAALNLPSLVGKSMEQALVEQKATAPATVTVPASASIHGLAPAFFHTDARVFNPSTTSPVTVTARFRCFTGPCPSSFTRTFTVAPREMKVLDDVIVSLFGAPETAGPIEFDGAVLVETRTYTPGRTEPTNGSVIPGSTADAAHAEAVLMSLSHSSDFSRGFRTNAGVYNPNDAGMTATISLYTAAGVRLGSTTVFVGPRAAVQVANVFGAAGVAGDVADAYAVVRADGILPLFAYATVIDNQSLDPTYVAGRNARGAAAQTLTVPAAASIHGVPPAFFHSDARIFNPSETDTASVGARFRCFTGPCPADPVRTFTVAPREMKVFDDALVSLFGSPETAGPVELFGPVHIETRVYTPSRPEPTAGTGTPGLPDSAAAAESVLLALSHSASAAVGFRTNVGVFNPDPVDRSCTVSLHRPDGTKLADLTRTVPGGTAVQISGVFGAAGIAGDVPDAYAIVKAADGRPLFSYATVIDNRTGDSVFLAGRALN